MRKLCGVVGAGHVPVRLPDRKSPRQRVHQHPPAFLTGPSAGAAYPDEFAVWQREIYPDVAPLESRRPPAEVFAASLALAQAADGWRVLVADPDAMTFQALVLTPLFRFEDDVVVRVRAAQSRPDTLTVVDARSRSRYSAGDRGANANRLRDFFATLEETLAAHAR